MVRANDGETYRKVLALREFRYLWMADILSVGGDQLGRIALSLLVFARTDSAALTGLTYGLTFVPTLLGSVFLAGFADHYPRRNVMIAADVIRALLIALVAVPQMPLWLLCVLVAGSTMFNGPFKAAQQSLVADVLPRDLYLLGVSLRTVSMQIAQLAGFALGGAVVTLLSPAGGLLFDAGTFLASALLLLFMAARPVRPTAGERAMSPSGLARGFTTYLQDKRLLILGALVGLNLFHIIPEGTAAPYISELGVGSWGVALVLASAPLGAAIGAFVFARLISEERRARLVGPAAIGASIALIPTLAPIGLVASLVLFAIAGALSAIYTMYASAMITQMAPERDRGRVSGVYMAIIHTSNGIGPVVGGAVAGVFKASGAIAGAGIVSAILATVITVVWFSVLRTHSAPEREPNAVEFPAPSAQQGTQIK